MRNLRQRCQNNKRNIRPNNNPRRNHKTNPFTFGPIDLHQNSPNFGSILNTPKLAWKNFNYIKSFSSLGIPIAIDTDVNASCLGEVFFGNSKGLDNVVYVTIGTGIGIGVLTEGKLLHGMMHPEGGHMIISKCAEDNYESVCPYHKNCLEKKEMN